MAKKTKNNWIIPVMAIAICALIGTTGALFFKAKTSEELGLAHTISISNIYYHNAFEVTPISEDGKWLLWPEFGLKIPASKDLTYQQFSKRPYYRLAHGWNDPENGQEGWEIELTYFGAGSNDLESHFAPVILAYDDEKSHEVGDIYSRTNVTYMDGNQENHKEVHRIVDSIAYLNDGRKIYILYTDLDAFLDDQGENRYRFLLDALKNIEVL